MVINTVDVTFEHHREALGIGQDRPRISWRFSGDEKSWIQKGYEVKVIKSTQQESFRIKSEECVLVPWPSAPLEPGVSATVLIRAFGSASGGECRNTPWSQPVNVEMGLKPENWTASLIESTKTFDKSQSHSPILFRRQFNLKQAVSRARLYITAHGIYEAEVNGHTVGDHVLEPGWTSYEHRLLFQTFDVGHLLVDGDNALGAHVGAGWYCGRLGFRGGERNIWGDDIGLFAQLVIHFIDGTQETVVTDSDWKWSMSPIWFSELYDGERYDARKDLKAWCTPSFRDSGWQSVKSRELPDKQRLQSPESPPVRRIQEVQVQRIFKSPSNKTIVDFGQNLVGWLRVQVNGPEGHKISFTHTEVLEDGEVATRPLRQAESKDTLVLSGKEPLLWEPKFTFHGFRYVQVDNWPSAELKPNDLMAIVIHTDMVRTGWFECSDSLLNKLHENICWSMRGNFLSIPTDCPQRDERLGWTGDLGVFANTANYLYDTCGTLTSWLKDVAAEQMADGSGVPPLVTPDALRVPKTPQAIWGDVVVSCPWDLYEAFGDRAILSNQYHSMKAWVDSGIPRDDRGLWDSASASSFQLGDWLDPKAPSEEPRNGVTDPYFVANAHLIRSMDLMVKASSVLGISNAVETYRELATKLRSAFAREYITESGRVAPDTQTAIALALHFSLFLNREQEQKATERLKQLILKNSRFKIATGFAGTPILGPALTKMGESQLFYRMLLHKKCPSWLYPVTMGATTIWERWDSMLPNGRINPGEMTSFNHYALGAVAHWMHTVIGGISSGVAGWKTCHIKPVPGGGLKSCTASHLSPYGMVKVSWSLDDGEFILTASVPPNTTAEIELPGSLAVKTVGSGNHSFHVAYEEPPWPPIPIYDPFTPHDDDQI